VNDKTKQLLTEEVLGECWHDYGKWFDNPGAFRCKKCGMRFGTRRTFATRSDMMDLYQAIQKTGRWNEFMHYAFNTEEPLNTDTTMTLDEDCPGSRFYDENFIIWLVCLNGEDYEKRCQMVADWPEGERK